MVQDHGEHEEGVLPKICSHVGGGEMILELLLDNFHLKDITVKRNSAILTPLNLTFSQCFLNFSIEFHLLTDKKTPKVGIARNCQMPFEDSC